MNRQHTANHMSGCAFTGSRDRQKVMGIDYAIMLSSFCEVMK